MSKPSGLDSHWGKPQAKDRGWGFPTAIPPEGIQPREASRSLPKSVWARATTERAESCGAKRGQPNKAPPDKRLNGDDLLSGLTAFRDLHPRDSPESPRT